MSERPSVEDIFQSVLGGDAGGWDAFFKNVPADPRHSDDWAQAARDAASVFATEPGRRLLEYVLGLTLRKATWPGDLNLTRDQLVNYGVFREGQNSIAVLLCALTGAGEQADAEERKT